MIRWPNGVNYITLSYYVISGTMLSHDSMTYAARQNMSLFKLEYAQETSVSYLPQVCLINIRTDPTQLTIWVKYECDNQTYICIRPVAYSGDDDGHLQHDSSGGCLLLCGQERLEGHFAREHPTLQVNQQPPGSEMISFNSDQHALWEFQECGRR